MRVKDREDGLKRRKEAYDYLIGKGLKPHLVAGVIGNLMQESYSHLDSTVENSIGAVGIAQWLGPRKQSLIEFANDRGSSYKDFDTQLDFLYHELTNVGDSWTKQQQERFFNAKNVEEAAAMFVSGFERSGEKPGDPGFDKRLANAKRVYLQFNDKEIYAEDEKGNIYNVDPNRATVDEVRNSPSVKDRFYKENFNLVADKDIPEQNEPPVAVQEAREAAQTKIDDSKTQEAFMKALQESRQKQDSVGQGQQRVAPPKTEQINPSDYLTQGNEFMDFFLPPGA